MNRAGARRPCVLLSQPMLHDLTWHGNVANVSTGLVPRQISFSACSKARSRTRSPFSLRDDCMDAGGRAKPGAIAEKDGMRGVYSYCPLTLTLVKEASFTRERGETVRTICQPGR